jgi:ubiquinone/menaquinone biosynthesis C-methylase UbiE
MAYDKRQATEEFIRWSGHYDRDVLQWLLFGPSHRAIIARIRDRNGDGPLKVLDIGCGTGLFATRIREAFPRAQVCGVDLVPEMLAGGRERWRLDAEHISPIQGDSERLPLATGSFDVVTCANSFHHYPHQDRAVAEMHRVLRPGGCLILVDGYRDAPWGWFIYDVCVAHVEGDVHHASSARMRSLFAQAGFPEPRQKVYRGPAPFLMTEAVKPVSAIPAPHFAVPTGAGVGDAGPASMRPSTGSY